MTKGLLLLVITTFNTNRMGSKYLLVQLEDARDESDERIKFSNGENAALGPIADMLPLLHQSKHSTLLGNNMG